MYTNGQRTIFDFPGKAKSVVWKNFGFYLSDDGYTLDRTKAICKYCRISVRYTGNTTNLHTHFVNHHRRQDKNKHGVPQMTFSEPEVLPSTQSLSDIVHMPVAMPTVSFSSRNTIKSTPHTLAIMEYFICDLIPFDNINSQAFQNLIFTLDKNCDLPSMKHLEDVLMPSLYSDCVDKLLSKLEMLDNVTLTIDVWSLSHKLMTLSANFISPSWNLNTFVLGTVPLPDELEAKFMDQTFQDLEKKWQIGCDPILVAGDEVVLKAGEKQKWSQLSCFAETINSAAIKGLELPSIQNVINAVRKLFHLFKSGPWSSTKQQVIDVHSLILDTEDRWLSTFNMLQKAVEYLPAMDTIIEENGLKDEKTDDIILDSKKRTLCQGLVELLKPLSNASMLLCDQQMVSASLVLPALKKLQMTHNEHETDYPELTECRDVIWTEIQKNYSTENTRDFLLVCSLLDPRYKGLRYVEPVEKEKARRLLYDEALKPFIPEVEIKQEVEDEDEYIQSIIMGQQFALPKNDPDSNEEIPTKKRRIIPSTSKNDCDWLSDVVGNKEDSGADSLSPMELLSAEIDRYMKEKQITARSPLAWWNEREKLFPNLSRLGRKYMSVMAVCKPPEQVFLQEKDLVKFQRAAIKDKNLDPMIFLSKNYQNLKNQS